MVLIYAGVTLPLVVSWRVAGRQSSCSSSASAGPACLKDKEISQVCSNSGHTGPKEERYMQVPLTEVCSRIMT